MGDAVCAARTGTLTGFADAGLQGRLDIDATLRVSGVSRDWAAMEAACAFRSVSGNPGPSLGSVLDQLRANEAWVEGIARGAVGGPALARGRRSGGGPPRAGRRDPAGRC